MAGGTGAAEHAGLSRLVVTPRESATCRGLRVRLPTQPLILFRKEVPNGDGNTNPPDLPTTPNGLASPDYRVAINQDLLDEIDGPMLKHGLQDMHGRALTLPTRRPDQPDRELLAWTWARFTA